MLLYVIIFIGALWGILTFVSINEEDKEIKEMVQSARLIYNIKNNTEKNKQT